MHKILPLIIVLIISFEAVAQDDAWIETNDGIADYSAGERFELKALKVLQNGRVLAFVNDNIAEIGNGVFELDSISWTWTKIAGQMAPSGQNGRTRKFNKIVVDGNNIYDIGGGATVYELNLNNDEWTQIFSLNINSNDLPQMIDESQSDIVNGFLYLRIAGIRGSRIALVAREFPDENFQEEEVTIMKIDLQTSAYEFIRNPNNPLIIETRGGSGMRVLSTGEMYLLSTWEIRAKEGWGGLYQWDGTNWVSISQGLNVISTTNNFGPLYMGPTNPRKTRLFVRSGNGFYERLPDGSGWFNYFSSIGGTFSITESNIFAFDPKGGGDITQVDRALKIPHRANFDDCFSWMRNFFTPNDGGYFLIAPQQTFKRNSDTDILECSSGNNGDSTSNLGIYRYLPTEGKPAGVLNLHLENGTYLGGEGDNFASEVAYSEDDKLLLAGYYNSNMGIAPTNLFEATNESHGKIYIANEWGTEIEKVYNLGNNVYDIDVEENTGEIAVIGDFGVAVLNPDFSIKWRVEEDINSDVSGEYRPRVAIAENGKVVASGLRTDENIVRLYHANGAIQHTNNKLDQQARKIYDVEISSSSAQQAYYVCGFQQNTGIWQSAYLQAYDFTSEDNPERKWQSWGFSVGRTYGEEEMTIGGYGADTRLYRIKVAGDSIYVAGETAGGGPGGFTIFACNGKELQTRIANTNNDFYSDGTISCGSCHISFIGIVDVNGTALNGKFAHARKTDLETNAHRVNTGDLDVDEDKNVYISARISARFQDRDALNINGNLLQEYGGSDLGVLVLTPDLNTRTLWAAFPKANRGGGRESRIAARKGKTAFFATSTRGELFTTDNAIQSEPYSIVRIEGETDTLKHSEAYLSTWHSDVWNYANEDSIERRFISADECFYPEAYSDLPCPLLPDEGESLLDAIEPFNIITPNGDGVNDEWRIDGINLLDNFAIKVFTSNGQVVFEATEYTTRVRSTTRWVGTNQNGDPLPQGVYYYTIYDLDSGQVRTGYITLLR